MFIVAIFSQSEKKNLNCIFIVSSFYAVWQMMATCLIQGGLHITATWDKNGLVILLLVNLNLSHHPYSAQGLLQNEDYKVLNTSSVI